MKESNSNTQMFSSVNDDIISISTDMEDSEMVSKFYNFQCINLYGYIDYNSATLATNNAKLNEPINHLINTPIELYESPYMAKYFAPKTGNRQMMAFAVYVADNIYDELDLQLEQLVKRDGRKANEIKASVSVIRQLKSYKAEGQMKAKPYISYIINNQNAIKQIFPI